MMRLPVQTMSASSTDKGLLTPENCAVIFDGHQLFLGVSAIDRQALHNNFLILAKAAKIFSVPVILTAIEARELSGNIAPQVLALFQEVDPVERTSMNSWDSAEFVRAVKRTGRKNFLLAALWAETCLTFPALQMLEEGYGIYPVEDASGGVTAAGRAAAIRRVEQAGAVCVTALQVLLEFQRDWSRKDHYDEVMVVLREHCCPQGQSISVSALKTASPYRP
jgi:nicotinamidase-related amidase